MNSTYHDKGILKMRVSSEFLHNEWIYTTAYFPKFNYLISGSEGGQIRVYNATTSIFLRKIFISDAPFKRTIRHILKNQPDRFLICGDDGALAEIKIDKFRFSVTKFVNVTSERYESSSLLRIVDISESSQKEAEETTKIATIDTKGYIYIIDLPREKILQTITFLQRYKNSYSKNAKLVASQKYENSFYVNSSGNQILLFNYESSTLYRKFKSSKNSIIYDLNIFNFSDREILFCGGHGKKMFFYDSSSSDILLTIDTHDWVSASFVINNRYLVIGQFDGSIEIYRFLSLVEKDFVIDRILCQSNVHEDRINGFSLCFDRKREKNVEHGLVDFVSCSNDCTMKIVEMYGLSETYYNEYIQIDFKERSEYLISAILSSQEDDEVLGGGKMMEIKVGYSFEIQNLSKFWFI